MKRTPIKRTPLINRILPGYTRGEELFNMISHIVGGVFAFVALVLTVVMAAHNGDVWGVVAASIYGVSMLLLYTMSSIYHGLKAPMPKRVFQVIDHCAIFLLIAGSYTPLTLCALRPQYPVLAWWLFGIVWGVAILGITLNAIDIKKYAVFSMVCYLAMGWCVVLMIKPLLTAVEIQGLLLLVAGGIAYTIGAVLYGVGKKRLKYMHSVFHLFVVVGSVFHFFCILFYIIPINQYA